MKRFLLLFVMIALLAACAPQAQPTDQSLLPNDDSYANPDSYPNGSYPNDNSPASWTPAQQAAVTALSQSLNLPPGKLTLTSTEAVDWPNGCLGVQKLGMMCTQAIVPGYKILIEADGQVYEVRTNEDGTVVEVVSGPAVTESLEEELIKRLAANLGLETDAVKVVSTSEIEFGDACLGVALPSVSCAQVMTPGKIIVLEANGEQYTYHTTADGSFIQPADLLLTWKREGGIAGFCDVLMVYRSGDISGNQCKSQPNEVTGSFAATLTAEERSQLETWQQELGAVNLDLSDPEGVSDRMVVTLDFYGSGKGSLAQSDQQAMLEWVQSVFQKLYN